MKSHAIRVSLLACLLYGWSGMNVIGQSVPDTVAGHVAAAKAAGGSLWPGMTNLLCEPALQAPAAAPAQQAPQQPQGPPPRSVYYEEPEKVFDNVWVLTTGGGTGPGLLARIGGIGVWVIKTSEGLILTDATYDYAVKEVVEGNLRKAGLDPAAIKHILITHGHGDHFGGVKYLQELYNPRVWASPADWNLMSPQPSRGGGGQSQPLPRKDMDVTDGMKLTLGDTTVTVYITPGHSPGTISFLIPVKINGTPHLAAFWGGTALSRNTSPDNLRSYAVQAKRFEDIAVQAKADVILSNHDGYGEYKKRIAAMKANPSAPNPFVVGVDGVKRYMQVLQHCSLAILAALR